MGLFDLGGKVALVTGAGRGLGREVALALAEHGARVVLTGRRAEPLAAVAAAIAAASGRAEVVPADIRDAPTRARLMAEIETRAGGLDILVNNAGVRARRRLAEFVAGEFEAVLATNLVAPFELCRDALPLMRGRGGGRIINMASIAGPIARAGDAAYTASKAGLIGLTRALAAELGPEGITVNAIAPGYFSTEANAEMAKDPEIAAWLERRTSLGRWGRPEEIRGAAVFLASDAASFVTGQVLFVDGGHVSHF